MNHLFLYILSIPKTLWVNFKCLPFRKALRIPIVVSYDSSFHCDKNNIDLNCDVRKGMIRIGFHEVPAYNRKRSKIIINGRIEFNGEAHIGNGSIIYVSKNAKLILGDDFKISASSSIICYKSISFGNNIQFSWDCIVMDSDTHNIIDENGNIYNNDLPIIFGNNIWIGCRCTILKGSVIPDCCVIGSMSLVSGKKYERNSVIAGVPAKTIKRISGWKL